MNRYGPSILRGAVRPNRADADTVLDAEMGVQQSFLLVARRLRQKGWPVVGLWPVSPDLEFEEVTSRLARAFGALGRTTALIAPERDWRDGSETPEPFVSSIGEGVDSITPVSRQSGISPTLEHTLSLFAPRYAQVLLDLSGLDLLNVKDVSLLPGVGLVLFLCPGQTSEFVLAKLQRRLPSERLLGAVFVA